MLLCCSRCNVIVDVIDVQTYNIQADRQTDNIHECVIMELMMARFL